MRDEIKDCPWKAKRGKDKDNDDGSDDEDGCSRPWKRASDGSQRLPQVSTDCDLTPLFLHESEEESGGSSDEEGNRCCPV